MLTLCTKRDISLSTLFDVSNFIESIDLNVNSTKAIPEELLGVISRKLIDRGAIIRLEGVSDIGLVFNVEYANLKEEKK